MSLLKVIFQVFLLILLGACGAQGPIKVYDQQAITDTANLAILYLPPEIELVEADGMVFETPFIETGYNEVQLPPGHHEIAVKYVKFWGDASSGNLVSSKPVIYSLELANKTKYFMKFTRPKDQWDAQDMVDRFSPWIEDENGVKVKVTGTQYGTKTLTDVNRTVTAKQFVEGNNPLEKLKFWWKNSNREEKEAFKKWLEED